VHAGDKEEEVMLLEREDWKRCNGIDVCWEAMDKV